MDVTERGKNTIKHAEGLKRVIPVTRFIGDLEVSGDAFINSSSFSIPPSNTKGLLNNTFIAGSIVSSGLVGDTIQEDSIIRELKLSGLYEVIIKLKGSFNVPFSPASYNDYVAVRVPSGFDAVLRLQERSTAEFLVENDKGQIKQPLKFGGEGEIHLSNVRDPTGRGYTPVLLKAPEIHVTSGKTDIDKLYVHDPSSIGRVDSNTKHIKAIGRVDAKIVHFDHYSQENLKGTRTDQESLTYLDFIDTDQAQEPKESGLKLPAGLSDFLKKKEVGESWRKAIFTNDSIILSISVPIVAVTVVLTTLWRLRWLNG
jgi:hypothetical protein